MNTVEDMNGDTLLKEMMLAQGATAPSVDYVLGFAHALWLSDRIATPRWRQVQDWVARAKV